MQYVRWTFILSVFLFSPLGFASSVLISQPQDEELDPVGTMQVSVRPGQKLSLAAGVFDRDSTGKGWVEQNHPAQEFSWQASCMSSSSACPTVSMGAGVVVTIDIPICMQVGSVVYNVTFPGLPPATVTLANTEEPSICPAGDNSAQEPYQADPAAISMRSQSVRSSSSGGQGGGSGGGGYGSGGSGGKGVDGRRNNGGGFSGSDFFGGGGNSGAIVDPYRPPAMVMECSRGSRNQLVCQDVDMIRAKQRIQVRAQKLNRAKVAQPKQQPQRQMPKPRLKQAMKPKRKVFPRFAAYVSK